MIAFELKKMLLRPSTIIVLLFILLVNGITLILDNEGKVIRLQDIQLQRMEQSQYKGEINQNWSNLIQATLQAIKENPDNLMSKTEKEQVRQDYLQMGYTQEYVNNLESATFLKTEILNSLSYRILVDAEYASAFYDNAQEFSIIQGNIYRTKYKGKKGEILAAKAEEMYGNIAQNYMAYYDYNLGWCKIISMQYLLPFTIGLFLIVTLSTIFSREYSQKTDSLLLSTKFGKSKLIHAKIIAALLLTVGSWLTIQTMNLLTIAWLFDLQGAQTFVQDWVFNKSPFAFTQLTNYLALMFMSVIGVLMFAAIILFTSAKTKTPFLSLLVSGFVLLSPVMGKVSNIGGFISELLLFMPSQMLIATNHFTFFKAYYVFGNALLMQYAVPVAALMASALMVPIAYRTFQQRQVEN